VLAADVRADALLIITDDGASSNDIGVDGDGSGLVSVALMSVPQRLREQRAHYIPQNG
jgi:hypothetical protein